MYRDRLIRAYLGASNPEADGQPLHRIRAQRRLPDGRPEYQAEAASRPEPDAERRRHQPPRLAAAQGRVVHRDGRCTAAAATSAIGPSSAYGGGITLGTAVAISGAAASPNMGYHSSPVVGLHHDAVQRAARRVAGQSRNTGGASYLEAAGTAVRGPRSLVKEALGQTTDQSKLRLPVRRRTLRESGSLRDGAAALPAHRRARRRAAIPTSRSTTSETRCARSASTSASRSTSTTRSHVHCAAASQRCALATIRYSDVDGPVRRTDGSIYVKPVLLGTEPPDVQSYAAAHPAFPHKSPPSSGSTSHRPRAIDNSGSSRSRRCAATGMANRWLSSTGIWRGVT